MTKLYCLLIAHLASRSALELITFVHPIGTELKKRKENCLPA